MLGFTFDSDVGCSSHVEKIAARMGASEAQVLRIFDSRTDLDLHIVHSMLTADQSAFLEKQQTQALRNIRYMDMDLVQQKCATYLA